MSKKNEIDLLPWEQQPGETAKMYEAFQAYLFMKTDDSDRSLRKVAHDLNKSLTHIGNISKKNNWVERVEAWDSYQLKLAHQDQLKEIKKMRKRHATIATTMLTKVTKKMQQMEAEELTPQDIKAWVDVATKLERLSRGDSSEVIEERDGGQALNPVQVYLPDNGRDGDSSENDD